MTREAGKLAMLLDALDGVPLSDSERASLTWLAGFEAHTVENIAAVITRARGGRAVCADCNGTQRVMFETLPDDPLDVTRPFDPATDDHRDASTCLSCAA